MTRSLQCIVLDCPRPRELAAFYQALLGGEVDRADPRWSLDDDWSTLHLPDGGVLGFQRAHDHRPPRWPDPAHPQQFHLDIAVDDVAAAERDALANGAKVLRDEGDWGVYEDPAGHPFCLVPE
ncbi:glyoxalase [Streptomyces sp. WAC 06738]|jgi:catechol 2,3-dioxygenase-like lactoylglutathione lyase family enzyme|uniref:VOC family protein n=1 Tax=Streptomyces sp. WAC 06738 TaxID=2203210 RepID=UPI000F6FB593|nr:VOC family protein [Streptomyces sp. WAC 06738]AZM44700.1 glyoxalase [Streptomyces sp. WAC 06738]